jgi:hypothetical protein
LCHLLEHARAFGSGTQAGFVFLTSKRDIPMHPSSTVGPAGQDECRVFRCVGTRLKGKMFELFAYGLCGRQEAWNEVLTDPSAETSCA